MAYILFLLVMFGHTLGRIPVLGNHFIQHAKQAAQETESCDSLLCPKAKCKKSSRQYDGDDGVYSSTFDTQ